MNDNEGEYTVAVPAVYYGYETVTARNEEEAIEKVEALIKSGGADLDPEISHLMPSSEWKVEEV